MSVREETLDVFLAYAAAERPTAEQVRRSLEHAGLNVFDPALTGSAPGVSLSDQIWQALAVSDAIVAVLPAEGDPNSNTAAEIGAGAAWNKPIYLVSAQNGRTRTPAFLSAYQLYPVSRVDDIALAIKRARQSLSPQELSALQEIYLKKGESTDQLIRSPALLDKLAQEFRAKTKKNISGERLLNEMIRLRKQGQWPKLKKRQAKLPS